MSTFLPSLYQEYQDLSTKLFKVSDLILEYGGELPEKDTTHFYHLPQDSIVDDNETEPPVQLVSDESTSGDDQPANTSSNQLKTVTNNISADNADNSITTTVIQTGFDYPLSGSWKDKIIYALRIGGKPCIAREIANFIQRFESPDNANRVLSMVRQYTSTLSKAGKIGVDNSAHAHKYFLIT